MKYDIFKAVDQASISKLFEKKLNVYFPKRKNQKIKDIVIEKISPDWAKDSCLVKYKIFLASGDIKIVRGSAKKHESREPVFLVMQYLWNHKFNKGNYIISRPLDFIEKANLLLYQEAPGKPFASIIQEGNLQEVKADLKKIANWLAKLHSLKPRSKKIRNSIFLGKKNYQKMIREIPTLMPSLKQDLEKIPNLDFLEKIWTNRSTLIHDDFYPGNIIIDHSKIAVIDFDRTGFGPALMDVATLYGVFEFPEEAWKIPFTKEQTTELQKVFFNTYCAKRNLEVKKTHQELNFFLIKIFLDQIHYYFYFAKKGWKFMNQKAKIGFTNKIKALILKIEQINKAI